MIVLKILDVTFQILMSKPTNQRPDTVAVVSWVKIKGKFVSFHAKNVHREGTSVDAFLTSH
jgi:hypothetical protein